MAGVKGRSGGPRPNCSKPRQEGSVRWQREQRRLRKVPAAGVGAKVRVPKVAPAAVVKPKGLPAGQAAVWDALAPQAIAQRTLTEATAFAFVELCEAIVMKRDMARILEADGVTTVALKTRMEQDGSGDQIGEVKAHPLIAKWTALLVRVEAGLTRFRLAPMGKEMPAVEEPEDAFAEFDAPLTLVRGGK